jgi:hypothetical protein
MDSSRQLRPWLITLTALLLITPAACAQITDIKVQIVNAKPKAQSVHATSIVKSAATDVVWCTGVLADLNSYKDFKILKAYIGIPSEEGYIQKMESDFLVDEQTSVTEGLVTAGFVLTESAAYGTWNCVIEGVDHADDKASGQASFTVSPASCDNGAQDMSEESLDCGGSCLPCSCKNGVEDKGETGTDCGGPCGYCPDKGLLMLTVPPTVNSGDVITIQVKAADKGVASLIRATKPSGKLIVFKTDDSGVLNLNSDEAGRWRIQADLYGYAPAEGTVEVKSNWLPIAIAVTATLIGLATAAYILTKKKTRPKVSLGDSGLGSI